MVDDKAVCFTVDGFDAHTYHQQKCEKGACSLKSGHLFCVLELLLYFLLASQARSCGLFSQPVDACFWGNIVPASLFLLARQAMCYMVCLASLLMFVSGAI